jgi:hypothetical protein
VVEPDREAHISRHGIDLEEVDEVILGDYTADRMNARRSRLPEFATIEEEAEFWDTHDITEFEDELEPATNVKFVRGGPTRTIDVRLDEETFAMPTEQARELGVRPSRLARLILFEHFWQLKRSQARQNGEAVPPGEG